MAGALAGTGLELIYIPWDAATLGRQRTAVWQDMQAFYKDEPDDAANGSLAGSPLVKVKGCTIHQAYLVMACVHVARQVRLPSLMVLLWRSRRSTCWCLSC